MTHNFWSSGSLEEVSQYAESKDLPSSIVMLSR
jgi:hypothetical protein